MGVYRDEGISGKSIEGRPEMLRLLEDAKQGLFEVVLCYHNDRLSRDTGDALRIVKEFLSKGIRLRCSNLDIDFTTPEGELFFTLQAGFAQYFRRDLGRKTSFGLQRVKKEGYWVGRLPELFDSHRENHTTVFPTEIVARIIELRAKPPRGVPYRKIAPIISQEFAEKLDGKSLNHVQVWQAVKIARGLSNK